MNTTEACEFGAALHELESDIPPMFHHVHSAGGLANLLEKLDRRAKRTRDFLKRYEWKVMFCRGFIAWAANGRFELDIG